MKSIVDWLVEPVADTSLTFYQGSEWRSTGYPVLARESLGVANRLRDREIRKSDRVAIILPTGRDFVRYFFGALALGAIPTVIAPPGLHGTVSYPEYVATLLGALAPRAVIAEAQTLALLPDDPAGPQRIDTAEPVGESIDTTIDPALGEDISIIQFTSGSTRAPRAVCLSSAAVVAHIEMLKTVFRDRPADDPDSFGSWLPMHHDMGLIGTFLTPVSHCKDVWLMRPEQFVRRPLLWLELFGRHGVNHSASPNFALERIVRVVSPKSLAGMDFSTWRTVIIGSDRINIGALRALHDLLGPFGLRADALKPGYGMAETTLAVSTTGPGESPHALLVDGTKFRAGEAVPVLGRESLEPVTGDDADAVRVVGCGEPLPGARVLVTDDAGESLPEGRVGELVVESPAIFSGYLEDGASVPIAASNRRHHTGDLGFLRDGQIYVLGRLGNSVKINGNFVTAEDVEMALAERLGLHHDKVTAVLRDLDEPNTAAALLIFQQRVPPEKVAAALGVLTRMGLPADHAALTVIAPLAVPRTTSGKPKRAELWQLLDNGEVTARVCHVGTRSPLRERLR
ncbi:MULTISPECIES: AMP-binding protein [Nocardia]|uniref:AMP-binding protein n=1 Tax=Nocardia TaxID=1817 RepID=UPI00255C659B|nr:MULTISPECIES: AMP-binding protein [Nocardia]